MGARRRTGPSSSAGRRRRPEKPPTQPPRGTAKISPAESERQILELEAQNQALREAQAEIEEARKRYLDLYDFAPVGYFVFDPRGAIVDLNLTGAKMLGLPKNRLLRMPFVLFLNPIYRHSFQQHLKKVFSSNAKKTCELEISQKYQESVAHVAMESVALPAAEGATCWSAVIDITDRKSAERELMKARQELVEGNAQLRRLSARLLQTQEEERSRVAGDVHDSFASQLCVIKDQLQRILGERKDGRLKHVFNQLDIAIRDATRIQADLRPPVLDDLGLFPALNQLCREFQKDHPHIHVEKETLLEEDQVPDSIEVPVYRIAQEALENIAAHSGADSASSSLARRDGFIEFVMRDNGRGFDVEEMLTHREGKGLSTMRERVVLSGGLFDIESAAGEGTTLRVSWPFG